MGGSVNPENFRLPRRAYALLSYQMRRGNSKALYRENSNEP
jgi:hypothetical protein